MRFSRRVEFIRRLLQAGAKQKLLHALEKLGPNLVSHSLRDLDEHDRLLFFSLLAQEAFLEKVLEKLPREIVQEVLSPLSEEKLIQVLSHMPVDWVWAFLQGLEVEKQEILKKQLPADLSRKIDKISQYPAGSCGEIMHPEWVSVKDTISVEEAIRSLRTADPKLTIFYLYVVDEEGHLLGTVPLRSLLRADPSHLVSQVAVTTHIAVQAFDPRETAAQMVSQHKLLAIPVVDESHHLLGVIRVDDVIDIVQEEATEDMYRLAGLSREDRIFGPLKKTLQKRLVWMSINLATAFLAAWAVGLFQESIAKVVALAIFMPVVAGMGGNGGTQSLTLMTRALALGEIEGREAWHVLWREVFVGGVIGLITGLITGLVSWWWQGNFYLGLVLWLAMICNMMIAGFSGSMIPMVLRTLRIDPALGSGVIVTTFTDVFGFLSFLGLATIFLKYLV